MLRCAPSSFRDRYCKCSDSPHGTPPIELQSKRSSKIVKSCSDPRSTRNDGANPLKHRSATGLMFTSHRSHSRNGRGSNISRNGSGGGSDIDMIVQCNPTASDDGDCHCASKDKLNYKTPPLRLPPINKSYSYDSVNSNISFTKAKPVRMPSVIQLLDGSPITRNQRRNEERPPVLSDYINVRLPVRTLRTEAENVASDHSKFPNGSVWPAHHFIHGTPNRVRAGKVSVHRNPLKMIKQPIYLRQGFGIYLKKFQRPRREHYGPKPRPRLEFSGKEQAEKGRSPDNPLRKALYCHGVVMTCQQITATDASNSRKLRTRLSAMVFEEESSRVDLVGYMPDIRHIVFPYTPIRQLFLPLPIHQPLFALYDKERLPAPEYGDLWMVLTPPEPLPPHFTQYLEDSLSYSGDFPSGHSYDQLPFKPFVLLRMPLRTPSRPLMEALNYEPEEAMSFYSLFRDKGSSVIRQQQSFQQVGTHGSERDRLLFMEHRNRSRYTTAPEFAPMLDKTPGPRPSISTAREQKYVRLGDVFPIDADKGALAEFAFYRFCFPLLVARNPAVVLQDFEKTMGLRQLPYYQARHLIFYAYELVSGRRMTQFQFNMKRPSFMEDYENLPNTQYDFSSLLELAQRNKL